MVLGCYAPQQARFIRGSFREGLTVAGQGDLADFQHIGAVGNSQDTAGVLLGPVWRGPRNILLRLEGRSKLAVHLSVPRVWVRDDWDKRPAKRDRTERPREIAADCLVPGNWRAQRAMLSCPSRTRRRGAESRSGRTQSASRVVVLTTDNGPLSLPRGRLKKLRLSI